MLEVSSLRLDASTLIFAISMLALFMSAVSFILGRGVARQRSGLNEWGVCMACCAGAFLLFFFRGHAPWFLTFLMANVLVMAALPFGLLAHARMFEVPMPQRELAVVTAFGISGVMASFVFDVPRPVSIFTASLGLAIQIGMVATMIQQNIRKNTTPLAWISLAVMMLMVIAFSMRAMLTILGDANLVAVAANTIHGIGALLMGGFFISFSSIGFIAMVSERQQQTIVDRLRRDGLTGLYTRSAFFEMADEIEAMGNAEGYAIIFVDIDHFKTVNDTFGHAGGDITLAHAARLIASSIRISDIAVRYGGEEFCILLRGCGKSEAALFAENLVSKAAHQTVRLKDGRATHFTFSAGYACLHAQQRNDPRRETLEEIIDRADQALYLAKKQGRNRALAAHPVPLKSLDFRGQERLRA
jgi:diguanylate cyclase (GGDEF)-like protein